MPPFLKKTMVYLGLIDDEFDDYGATSARAEPVTQTNLVAEEPRTAAVPMGRVRALPSTSSASPGAVSTRPPVVRAVSPVESVRVQVVAPVSFGDAKEIADCLKSGRPAIVNLQVAERDLQRRMIDFCSGVTYALSGEMEKVAGAVFLLTPTNVKVSEEERQRLLERGYEQR
ncbi:MAG: cell division protein SepF [Acidimicrobiales bacterium]